MKHASLLVVLLFTLSSCDSASVNEYEKHTSAISVDRTANSPRVKGIEPSTETGRVHYSSEYRAKNESELSELDFETAYEMSSRALTDYYQAVWNGSDIELDTFIDNENLKQYTNKKIQSQYDVNLKNNLTTNLVKDIEIGTWEVKYTNDVDGGFLYLKLPAQINKSVGSYGEVTEFLVRNVNGKLVFVDWYTGTKDSYDFMVRGANLTIDNPDIWSDKADRNLDSI